MSVADKLKKQGPKKLLALDGGGIRGLITIEVLAKIETILREKSGRKDFVLADYFDYIAGTSTGAVIGTLLALGKPVDKIREIYRDFGKIIFDKSDAQFRNQYVEIATNVAANLIRKKFKWQASPYAKYQAEPLAQKLIDIIGGDNVTLGDQSLRTLLLIVMSNASTDSAWPVCNNPRAKYNDPTRPNTNSKIPLWRLVRASTAAPVYFPAEDISVGDRRHVFVDGGVTPYNNPAFQLFLQATLPPYNLCWPSREKEMLLVSIGTGLNPVEDLDLKAGDLDFLKVALTAAAAQFNSAIYQQDLLCRTFGKCLAGDILDREVGDMSGMAAPGGQKLFTYVRYNAELTRAGLDAMQLPDVDPKDIADLDSVEHLDELCKVGKRVAECKVLAEHFADFLPV
jgi:uncharacterized protein